MWVCDYFVAFAIDLVKQTPPKQAPETSSRDRATRRDFSRARQRLAHIAAYCRPARAKFSDLGTLASALLVVLVLSLLTVAIASGSGAAEIFRSHTDWIEELASP